MPGISQLAVSGYRSLRDIKLLLAPLTIITGANGTGKSSIYRALRLLADVAQGRLINSLAREGGLRSTLWAGPERISQDMRAGKVPIQGTVRSGPVSLRLGFSGDDLGCAIDLGLPLPGSAFAFDPEIKVEVIRAGGILGRTNLFAERRGPMIRVRRAATSEWRTGMENLHPFDSMVTHSADREERAAAMYTLLETCRLNCVNPHAWLADVLGRIGHGHPINRPDEFLPWNWSRTVAAPRP